mmetsp:Transcript_136205/g.236808  ORF Transcript_136205/g.236808 Transcript_136205/m.236808 type:complete len:296 (-) Transcript_136205:168-1055(-)
MSYGGHHPQEQQPLTSNPYGNAPPTSSGAYGPGGGFSQAPPGAYGQNPYGNQAPPGYQQPGYAGAPPVSKGMAATNPMNIIWFAAACCVMVGALISFITELFELQWVDALEMVYLFLFGAVLCVLDTPLFAQMLAVSELKRGVGKYIALLNRVTGKGIVYIFLGSALWSHMWINLEGSTFLLFLAVLFGMFIVFVGIASLTIAAIKSRNLDLVRRELRKDGASSLQNLYELHARMQPQLGITQEEFKKLTPYARGVQFETSDVKLIFNALSSHPTRQYLSIGDLQNWINSTMVLI